MLSSAYNFHIVLRSGKWKQFGVASFAAQTCDSITGWWGVMGPLARDFIKSESGYKEERGATYDQCESLGDYPAEIEKPTDGGPPMYKRFSTKKHGASASPSRSHSSPR